jgi:DNA-nicking Smr family endonuclease
VTAPLSGPDEDPFRAAMRGVRPLPQHQRSVIPPPVRDLGPRRVDNEDSEALAELSDLVSGGGAFDITDTTEFLEGAAHGVDRGLVRRLRRGDFAFRRHLDLHGLTVDEARSSLAEFFRAAIRDGERSVLLVHGRGLNSPDRVPVLKRHVVDWLSRGSWARSVLAFTSARPCDGGAGALYVLLRRHRNGRKQVRVTEGAKW